MGESLVDAAAIPESLVLISTHGGSGATTWARLLEAMMPGHVIEWQPGMREGHDRLPILVARSTATGLRAASDWVTRWRPELQRPVLLLVADAPFHMPQLARYRVRALSSALRSVIEVPYLYRLRAVDDPVVLLNTRPVAQALNSIRSRLVELVHTSSHAQKGRRVEVPIQPLAVPSPPYGHI